MAAAASKIGALTVPVSIPGGRQPGHRPSTSRFGIPPQK